MSTLCGLASLQSVSSHKLVWPIYCSQQNILKDSMSLDVRYPSIGKSRDGF